jgi:hypothetical protein
VDLEKDKVQRAFFVINVLLNSFFVRFLEILIMEMFMFQYQLPFKVHSTSNFIFLSKKSRISHKISTVQKSFSANSQRISFDYLNFLRFKKGGS